MSSERNAHNGDGGAASYAGTHPSAMRWKFRRIVRDAVNLRQRWTPSLGSWQVHLPMGIYSLWLTELLGKLSESAKHIAPPSDPAVFRNDWAAHAIPPNTF